MSIAVLAVLPAALLAQSSDVTKAADVVRLEEVQVTATIGAYHEETSSMATKLPMDLKEISGSLQVLNANAILDRNALTLQDVYSYVIGMNQISPNGNGFTFRGFSNAGSFTQNIQFDGLMGSTSSKGAVSAANVESVEFLKGPNSVLYGQMNPGGLLNIVSKSPQEQSHVRVFGSVTTFAGGYSPFGHRLGYVESLDLTGPIDAAKHWLYRVVVAGQELKPWRAGDFEHDFYLYPSLEYAWSKDTYFMVKAELVQEKRRQDDGLAPLANNVALAAPFNTVYQEPTDTARDRGEALSTQYNAALGEKWTFRFQSRSVWHRDTTRELTQKGVKITAANPVANTTIARQYNDIDNGHRYNYFDANVVGRGLGSTWFNNTVVVGVGGGDETFDNQRLGFGTAVAKTPFYAPALGVTPYPADGPGAQNALQSLDALGEYFSDQIKIGAKMHLSVGFRHDQQESHAIDTVNPTKAPYARQFTTSNTRQAGVVYDVVKPLSVYASYSESFTPNSVNSVDVNGANNFPPQTGRQVESGLKFETPNQKLFGSLAFYRIDRSNVAVGTGQTIPSGPFAGIAFFRLDGSQRSQGTEFELEWQPVPYWQLQAGAAISRAQITGSLKSPQTVGQDLANAPRNSGSLWNRFNVPQGRLKGLGAALGVIYVGRSWGGDPATAPTPGTNYYFPIPSWSRVDANLYYKWRRYNFALNVQNVLDRHYYVSATNITQLLPGDIRKITLSVRAAF